MAADAERDSVEWAQHTALVAISVARTVLDLVEAAVADRERLERLATSGRSVADTWLSDVMRLASTVATGFGMQSEPPPSAAPPAAASTPPSSAPPAPSRAPAATKRPARASAAAKRSKPPKKAAKRAASAKKVGTTGPRKRTQ